VARSPKNSEFLAEIAFQLREGLRRRDAQAKKKGQRYTRVSAAKDLNVSRASLQFYLAGAHMPSSDVLRRAMELWEIDLTYRGRRLTIRDLESPVRSKKSQPVQLSLWDSIKGLGDDALSVKVEKKGPQSVTLQVEIGFRAG
jgi:hypothetical protein